MTLIPQTSRIFLEAMVERTILLHRKAVYKDMVEHLGKFLDSDSAPAKIGIKAESDTLVVPQDVIMTIQTEITSKLAEIDRRVTLIEKTRMETNEAERTQPTGEKTQEAPKTGSKKRRSN